MRVEVLKVLILALNAILGVLVLQTREALKCRYTLYLKNIFI